MDQEKEKTNWNKFKSSVKRKSKCTDRSTRDEDKKRKKFSLDDLNGNEKKQLRQDDNSKKKEKRTNVDSDKKEQLRKYEKKEKKFMCDNLNDMKKDS